jgi:heptosyltransferase I
VSARDLAHTGPPPERILIVMLSAIGDAVHVLPVANALKRTWPRCEITWLIQPVPHRLVERHRSVDRFLLFRRRRGLAAWQGFQEVQHRFPTRPYDLCLALQVYFKAGVLTALAPARVKLGFDAARARDLNWLFTNERIEARGQRHVQDQYFEFLEHLGIDPHPAVWDIPFRDEEREAQARFFGRLERPACAVVVGTSKPGKNWSAEGYARVLDAMERDFGLQPLLVGGPSRDERRMADEVLARTEARVIDCLGDDLRRLVWLLDGSALVLSPDTGPLHISRALETPVIGLYGYTNPKRTGPYRKYQDLVVDGYAEFPGEAYPVSSTYRDGMRRVSVEAVLEKLELAVGKYLKG